MTASPHLALAAAAAVGLGGCIASSSGPAAMCQVTADCDSARGEVCAEGVCYGDPPDHVQFGALLVPPDGRTDLAVTELPLLEIQRDGTIPGLAFAPSIAVHGRALLACPTQGASYPCGPAASIAAQITVERVSHFAGGPRQSRTIAAVAGAAPGEDGFSFRLPREDGVSYVVTIAPEPSVMSDQGNPSAAELAPPRQITITADRDQTVEWILGDPAELSVIQGCVVNQLGNGAPFAGMHVVALGRWTALAALERASSQAVTGASGCFELRVPRKMVDDFDLVVSPAPDGLQPTLHLLAEHVPDPPDGTVDPTIHVIDPPLLMPNAPNPQSFRLPVRAPGSAGGQVPVAGAEVHLTTSFVVPPQPAAPDRKVEVSYEAQAVTTGPDAAEPGVAELMVFPGDADGNRTYTVSVVPPAGTEFASVFGGTISVGTGGGAAVLDGLDLGRRVAVTGELTTADGAPIQVAPVEVHASSLFRWNATDPQAIAAVSQLQFPTDTTDEQGGFFLWLDRTLVGTTAYYDLDVAPATYDAPRWSFDGLELTGDGAALELGRMALPQPSYARGIMSDPDGLPVAGAELRIYQIPDGSLCAKAIHLGSGECDPPAPLRGVWKSDDQGVVRPVLPDP